MFIRDFLYTIKILMRAKVSLFWTLVFPILLATFMYMAFGNIYEQDEMFRNIKVAVVTEDESANGLNYMLDALSDGDDALLSVTRMSESDAEIFAVLTCVCYSLGIAEFTFDDTLREVCMPDSAGSLLPVPTDDYTAEYNAYCQRMGYTREKMNSIRYKMTVYDEFMAEYQYRKKYYGVRDDSRSISVQKSRETR